MQFKHKISNFSIQKIIGNTSKTVKQLGSAQQLLIYVSGSYLIFYDPIKDQQVNIINHSSNILNFVVHPNQQRLVIRDQNRSGNLFFYDITSLTQCNEKQPDQCKAHRLGADLLQYSRNGNYLVSISNNDCNLFLWQKQQIIARNILSKPVTKTIFSPADGLITIGKGYIKIWKFQNEKVILKQEQGISMMQGKVLSFGKKFSIQNFIDADYTQSNKLVLASSQNLICILPQTYDKIQKWIDISIAIITGIKIINNVIYCCGQNSQIKAVDIETSTLKWKFPKPPPKYRQNITEGDILQLQEDDEFPTCLGITYINDFLITLYDSGAIFLWQGKDEQIKAIRSLFGHSDLLTCLAILQQIQEGQLIFFATASKDKTIRLWHYYSQQQQSGKSVDVAALLDLERNIYCRHLTQIIYIQTQHNVTAMCSYLKKSLVVLARQELLIFSLQTYQQQLHHVFQNQQTTTLTTNSQYILVGTKSGLILFLKFQQNKVITLTSLNFEASIQKLIINNDVVLAYGHGRLKCLSFIGQTLADHYNIDDSCLINTKLLMINKKTLVIKGISKIKTNESLSLAHQLDDHQNLIQLRTNGWLIVLLTTKHRFVVVNFSLSIVCTLNLSQNPIDYYVTQIGNIICIFEKGPIVFYCNQSQNINKKAKKWFNRQEFPSLYGSVWASRHRNSSSAIKSRGELQQYKDLPNIELQPSISIGIAETKQNRQVFNYRNDQNRNSIFDPKSISNQVNNVMKQMQALGPYKNIQFSMKSSVSQVPPRSKKRIFKQNQVESLPFTNNLVESCYKTQQINKQQQIRESIVNSSIVLNISPQKIKQNIQGNKNKQSQLLLGYTQSFYPQKPSFPQAIMQLLQFQKIENNEEKMLNLIKAHQKDFYSIYNILHKFIGKQGKEQKLEIINKMDQLWTKFKKQYNELL